MYSPHLHIHPLQTTCSTKFPRGKPPFGTATPNRIPPPRRTAHSAFVEISRRSSAPAAASRSNLPADLRVSRRPTLPTHSGPPAVPSKLDDLIAAEHPAESHEEGGDGRETYDYDDTVDAAVVKDGSVWAPDEIDAISSLFERGPPRKRGSSSMERPSRPPPLPTSRRNGLEAFPSPKHHVRAAARETLRFRQSMTARVYKNPKALVGIAREIGALPADVDATEVLDRWGKFLRKGSLSMTIKELGHMDLPDRALQVLCWAQKHQPMFFPDDRILSSTIEVLARSGKLKIKGWLDQYLTTASRSVMEAMARGFTRARKFTLARRVLLFAKDNNRILDPSIHAKLILESGKNPEKYRLAKALLDELGQREDFDLRPQDCTAVMKVCVRLGRFELVESLFNWYKASGRNLDIVMYTTLIHSRYCHGKYREALAAVWEMEESDMLLDFPAYRVVIRLCVALDDLVSASKYFFRLKEAGFKPTYDMYRCLIRGYAISGRLAKCRQICKEVEMAGMHLDTGIRSLLSNMEEDKQV